MGFMSLALLAMCAGSGLCDDPQKEPKIIHPVLSWSGLNRFSDGGGPGPKPHILLITDAKTFAKIWDNMELRGDVPQVNFEDYFVLTVTRPGGLDFSAWGGLALNEKGKATVHGRDVHPDNMNSRYHSTTIGIFPRSGIQTVDGMKLPAANSGHSGAAVC